jgi:thioredoxin reductase/Pyruvate/2-oxoacid:ferredoxin oxidoreductase delta subunit
MNAQCASGVPDPPLVPDPVTRLQFMNGSFLPLLLYAAPAVLIVAWYLRGRARQQAEHARQLEESIRAGLNEPASLHPVIDEGHCIASGVCVRSCPEQALGIVRGKAVLVNAAACIGHGACASACPTEAIRLVFGTERRGVDIPAVKPDFESNVPGIYIAGELGGMGLVRKAAEQGRQALESIRKAGRRGAEYDVVIVGAGPAGLAAGLGAIAHRLKYAIVEQEQSLGGTVYHYPRNKITMTAPVKLPLVGRVKMGPEISKEALLEKFQHIARTAGLQIRFGEKMEDIGRDGEFFVVRTTRGAYRTGAVLLAIGRRGTPRKLGVPGEELPKVVYRLIDPEQYRGKKVLVVGGGDAALEAAIALAGEDGCEVTLSYRSEAFSRVKPANRTRLQEKQEQGRVTVLLKSTVKRITPGDVTLVHEEREVSLRNDAVIVCAGGELPFDLLKKIGIAFETKRGTA